MVKPTIKDKVNFIVDYWLNPCDTPLVVYVETLWPAALLGLIEYMTFGVMDIWRGYFRPKQALRSRRHGTKRRKKKGKLQLPDIGDKIGEKLPGSGVMHTRTISDGTHHLWVIYGKLERVLWYVMVVEIVFDTIYKWTTALRLEEACSKGHMYRCLNIKPQVLAISGDNWEGVGFGDQVYSNPQDWGINWSVGGGSNIPTAVIGGVQAPWDPADPPSKPELGILVSGPGIKTRIFTSGPGERHLDGVHQMAVASGIGIQGVTLTAVCKNGAGGGFAKWTNVTFTAFADPPA